MSATQKIGDLTAEDLSRWRMVSADKELVDHEFPGLSISEARQVILKYWQVLNEIFVTYSVDPNAVIHVSPIDGGIYMVDQGFQSFE